MDLLKLNETQNTRLLNQINSASNDFATGIELPDTDAVMDGLNSLREVVENTSTSMETYRKLVLRDVSIIQEAADTIQETDSILGNMIHRQ